MSLKNSENVWVLGIFLGMTGLLAAGVLTLVSSWTARPIAEAQQKAQNAILQKLNLPEFNNDTSKDSVEVNGITFMAARKDGKIVGYAAKGATRAGYSGKIEAMVGFSVDGKITAVQIISHSETPGLGAAVCERKFQRTIFNINEPPPKTLPANRILDQFNGCSAAESGAWKITKDGGTFEFRTGATVSSRAVTALVNTIAANFAPAVKMLNEDKSK